MLCCACCACCACRRILTTVYRAACGCPQAFHACGRWTSAATNCPTCVRACVRACAAARWGGGPVRAATHSTHSTVNTPHPAPALVAPSGFLLPPCRQLPSCACHMPALQALYIGSNKLTSLPRAIGSMASLTALYAGECAAWHGRASANDAVTLSTVTARSQCLTAAVGCWGATVGLLLLCRWPAVCFPSAALQRTTCSGACHGFLVRALAACGHDYEHRRTAALVTARALDTRI